jgi:short-subunit dehydrogenase
MTTEKYALITGASSGLGLEYAAQLAALGHSLVLVARDRGRLEAVATDMSSRFGVSTEVIAADLHEPASRQLVASRLQDQARPIRTLVNNAGYGIAGDVAESDSGDEADHLTIHVTTPLELTKAALPGMLERGVGRIVFVSSVAGYLARGSYSAHKAWGLSMARSLNASYKPRGIHVSAVAPGFTRTEFHQRMGMNISGIPEFLWLSAPAVVAASIKAVEAGRAVTIPGFTYKALTAVAQIVPASWHQRGV